MVSLLSNRGPVRLGFPLLRNAKYLGRSAQYSAAMVEESNAGEDFGPKLAVET
jgi:hypothetical protein